MSDDLFDNVVLVDFDGVCGLWVHSFAWWMHENGYKKVNHGEYSLAETYNISDEKAEFLSKMFNESAAIESIPPMRDSIKYIRKLHEEHGYVFHCISAIPDMVISKNARWKNIYNLYGKTAFTRLTLCGDSKAKDGLLAEYANSGCYWIEDVPKNAEYGLKWGLKPILINHPYNADYYNTSIPKVTYWKEIYDYITGVRMHPV